MIKCKPFKLSILGVSILGIDFFPHNYLLLCITALMTFLEICPLPCSTKTILFKKTSFTDIDIYFVFASNLHI